MVSLEDAVIARLESGGHRFEILIDPNEAQSYKEGDEIDWEDSIAVDGIWADSAKGERSPENILVSYSCALLLHIILLIFGFNFKVS